MKIAGYSSCRCCVWMWRL